MLMDLETNYQFYTVTQIANFLHVSNMTIYRIIKSGELKAVKIGGSYRIRKDWLDAYFNRTSNEKGENPN